VHSHRKFHKAVLGNEHYLPKLRKLMKVEKSMRNVASGRESCYMISEDQEFTSARKPAA
jgi:hypothetical protein